MAAGYLAGRAAPREASFTGTTNYGADHTPPLSPAEFYNHFRFEPGDMDRLCRSLRISDEFMTLSRCRLNAEEALLMFLKVRACNKAGGDRCRKL